MAIKVQPFVIDEAVLDLIGREFKFDHAKGLAEWLKNSCDAYLREKTPDDEQFIIVRLVEGKNGQLSRIECIDFVGMSKSQIDDAFKRFFDPQAAKKGAKEPQIKTLGGHGNGGKFYMRQMFRTSRAITYRDGKMNIFGFNPKKQYGFEAGFEDKKITQRQAMETARINDIILPAVVKKALASGKTGFTVVVGETPQKVKGTASRGSLIDKLIFHPQARRLIERKPILILFDDEKDPARLTVPKLTPKEGFETAVIVEIPDQLQSDGTPIHFKDSKYPWSGRLVLKTSSEPLRTILRP
jgi:hypothetical protein